MLTGACDSALGVASSNTIPNNQMTASSWANLGTNSDFQAWRGRLGYTPRCWCANETQQNKNQWLQIDFLNAKKITGVTTQGQWQRWVTTYYFKYSLDNKVWNTYHESGAVKVLLSLFGALTWDGRLQFRGRHAAFLDYKTYTPGYVYSGKGHALLSRHFDELDF